MKDDDGLCGCWWGVNLLKIKVDLNMLFEKMQIFILVEDSDLLS
jgi:hypothetical protein